MRLCTTNVFISISVCVLCIFLALLQHYYYFSSIYKTSKKYDDPVFEDLIATDRFTALTFSSHHQTSDLIENDKRDLVLSNLNALLEAHHTIVKPRDYKYYIEPKRTRNLNNNNNNENFASRNNNKEVYNTLQAAIVFKLTGKHYKALKLFEHAAAIAPDNPDVLNWYGEYLEEIRDDIVTADELYFKALTYSPNHEGALVNHKRTSPLVDRLDLEMLRNIDEKKEYLKTKFNMYNFETLKKQAYYLHIYHTVGIEGNTMTVEQLRTLLETGQVIPGKSIIEHNEVLGLELAMKYVKSLSRKQFISVNDVLQMHKRIMGYVDPLTSGIFRNTKVFVGSHVPPSSDKLPDLMEAYAAWLNSDEAQNMHPVRYAALAHYKLVDIHPFVDGNGRTSRLIMNLILLRSGYPPIMILKEQRNNYYHTLNIANVGDVRPFVRFIAKCTLQILDMYIYGTEMLLLDDYSVNHKLLSEN